MARIQFLWKSLARHVRLQPRSCPYCGVLDSDLLGRKKLVLELRRCRRCHLIYRYPKDEPEEHAAFYDRKYEEGMTTELPHISTLERWVAENFVGTDKDFSEKIRLVQAECKSGRLLDYGCSWGYGILQFRKSGFNALGYEISRHRARFGREQLGLDIIESREALAVLPKHSMDVIFVSHVVEHLQDPRTAFADFQRLLRPNGTLFLFVPNAGGENARRLGPRWGPLIGEKHPLAIDAIFLSFSLRQYELVPRFSASPYVTDPLVMETNPRAPSLSGDELLAVAYPG